MRTGSIYHTAITLLDSLMRREMRFIIMFSFTSFDILCRKLWVIALIFRGKSWTILRPSWLKWMILSFAKSGGTIVVQLSFDICGFVLQSLFLLNLGVIVKMFTPTLCMILIIVWLILLRFPKKGDTTLMVCSADILVAASMMMYDTTMILLRMNIAMTT